MANIKYKHCLKVWETTYTMTKYLLMCKVGLETIDFRVLLNNLHEINIFSIAKAKVMLPLAKPIRKKNVYI